MIILLTLFPVVMLELLYLSPLLHSLAMAVATSIGNLLSVAATGFVLIPLPSAPSSGGYSRGRSILRGWRPPGSR
jgi:antibiotic biosynthesis monooxygenase (ABM) superfamily enzyme